MKATLIISTEYRANQPSVFIYANEQYYGCLIYPRGRDYPTDMNYWKIATCADADRYFSVKEVDYSDETFKLIHDLQLEIKEIEKCLKPDIENTWVPRPDKSKNSKEYKEYLSKKENQEKAQREIWKYNEQFQKIIYANRNKIREIILSVIHHEN